MGRLGQALSGVAGSVRRRPVRNAALSGGVAGVAAVVTVTVPAHAEMTQLFLGITVNGTSAGVGPHGPVGMATVLATASHLTAGPHRFTVHWTVPKGKLPDLGYQVAGAAYWSRGTKG